MKYLALSLFFVTASCGGDNTPPPDMRPSTYACDQTTDASPSCKEFTEISAAQTTEGIQGLCAVTLTPAACPRTNLLGGCRAKSATYTLTTWFYKGTRYMTEAQVMADCGSAYVPPN